MMTSGPNSQIVDMSTFKQVLEMDDEDDTEFSRGIIHNYLDQADTTIKEIEDAVSQKSLDTLFQRTYYLKGSSSCIGLSKVSKTCETMQQVSMQRTSTDGPKILTEAEALAKCSALLKQLKDENAEAQKWLQNFYDEHSS